MKLFFFFLTPSLGEVKRATWGRVSALGRVVVPGIIQIEWQGSVDRSTGLWRGWRTEPGWPQGYPNDVFAQADGDTLDDYAADQALVAPIRQPSASHFSFLLNSSDARFLFAISTHSSPGLTLPNSARLERRDFGQIRWRSPPTLAFNQWKSYFGEERGSCFFHELHRNRITQPEGQVPHDGGSGKSGGTRRRTRWWSRTEMSFELRRRRAVTGLNVGSDVKPSVGNGELLFHKKPAVLWSRCHLHKTRLMRLPARCG